MPPKTEQIAIRLEGALRERIKAYASHAARPGQDMSQAAAARALMEIGLDAAELLGVDGAGDLGAVLPAELFARVDAFAKRTAAAFPGMTMRRSDAIRVLLERALEKEGLGAPPAEESAPTKPRRKR